MDNEVKRIYELREIIERLNYEYYLLTSKKITIMSEIAERVKAIIVDKLSVDENEVTPNASFSTDLGADSLDIVEILMAFEDEFDAEIPDSEVEKIRKVGEIAELLKKYTE